MNKIKKIERYAHYLTNTIQPLTRKQTWAENQVKHINYSADTICTRYSTKKLKHEYKLKRLTHITWLKTHKQHAGAEKIIITKELADTYSTYVNGKPQFYFSTVAETKRRMLNSE